MSAIFQSGLLASSEAVEETQDDYEDGTFLTLHRRDAKPQFSRLPGCHPVLRSAGFISKEYITSLSVYQIFKLLEWIRQTGGTMNTFAGTCERAFDGY